MSEYKNAKKIKDLQIILFNLITFEVDNQDLSIVLLSHDGNPSFLHDLWLSVPNTNNILDFIERRKEDKEIFRNQMISLQNKEQTFKIVVQLIKSDEGDVTLRLVDTMFWFVKPE